MSSDTPPLRIGILGAANIAPVALVRPARQVPEVVISCVAARDPARARRFASRHAIARVHDDYASLVTDPEIDAVYNPLPNGLHGEWSIRALEAGKHVLCEKPLASNADEAERMAEAADKSGRILVEAFHWRYHPLADRVLEILASGELGAIRHVEAALCIPLLKPGDIRFRWDLAGGALMDTGCYAISMVRAFTGSEPEVLSARARLMSPRVDRFMEAGLRFEGGITGRITGALLSARLVQASASVRGEAGRLHVLNPVAPQLYHRLSVKTESGSRVERVRGDASYTHQLRAFAQMARGGPSMPTDARDGIANMRAIDAVYRAAGLPIRGT